MSAILMTKQANLLDVPVPSIGDVVVFVDADGQLKTRDSTGAVRLAGRFYELNSQFINQSRTGSTAGLVIQSTVNAGDVVGKVINFKGHIKAVAGVAGASNYWGISIGGLIMAFPAMTISQATWMLDYDASISVLSANTATGFIRYAAGAQGTTVATGDIIGGSNSGTLTTATIALSLKTPTTTSITNNFGFIEVL